MIPHAPRLRRVPPRFALLLLALAGAAPSADGRPVLPEPSLGTGSAAFAGGGVGHAGGVNALFVNPAALAIPSGSQAELGMMDLSGGLSPYTLFGARSGPYAYSLGYFLDGRIGPYRNGVAAGAAREAVPGLALGAAVRSQGGDEGFGVDADLGLLLRPRGWAAIGDRAVLGLAVRNLAESGVGSKPEGYRTLRSYALSLGARRDAARFLFVPVREPDASYEVRADGLRPAGLSHILSAGAGFTPSGALFLRGSMRLPHEGAATVAVGGFLRFRVGSGGLLCGYTLSMGGDGAGRSAPAHAFSLNVALGTRADRQPPWLAVQADRVYLGSGAPGLDRVHFRLQAADRAAAGSGVDGADEAAPPGAGAAAGEAKAPGEADADADAGGRGELREWDLAIHATARDGRKDHSVRTFRGRDLPPRLIRWDGRDEGGRAVPPGYYAFRLAAKDKAGNRSETAWQLVEVGDLPAAADPAAAPAGAAGPAGPAGPAGRDSAAGDSTGGTVPLPDILEGDDG